jgi:hypothetical protein
MLEGRESRLHLLGPLLVVAAALIGVVPWLHPNNTCKDWLEKWGQLAELGMWLPIHQVAMAGFALAAVAGLGLAFFGPPSGLGFMGGAGLAAGYGIQAMLVLVHASAVSTLGRAFNAAAGDAGRKQAIRITAEAFVSYDVAASGVAAIVLSSGAILTAWSLSRARVFSRVMGLFMAGVGAIWGLAYFHYVIGEWVPYTSLALWLAVVGSFVFAKGRRSPQGPQ